MPDEGVETLYGPYDENLKQLEAALSVKLRTSGSDVVIEGSADGVAKAERVFGQFAGLLRDGYRFQRGDVRTAAQLVQQNPNVELPEYFLRGSAKAAGRKQVTPKTVGQRNYLEAIEKKDIVFGVGPAGTGGGVVVDGRLNVGANAIGGEWGHNSLPWPSAHEIPGPPCYCGRHGCIETFLSGPGLAADYARTSGAAGVTSEEVVTRAAAGEAAASATLDVWEDRLARGLASVINLLDPDVIVVGGGLSLIDRLYKNVPERWGAYVFSDRLVTRLVPAAHGDASGVRGAAWLWRG